MLHHAASFFSATDAKASCAHFLANKASSEIQLASGKEIYGKESG